MKKGYQTNQSKTIDLGLRFKNKSLVYLFNSRQKINFIGTEHVRGGNIIEKAYKFRIYPNIKQKEIIQKTFGCTRYVYNHFLARRIEKYITDKSKLDYYACSAELTTLKGELEWLKEVDSRALQSSLKDLDIAYQNFFRRIKKGSAPGFPKYKLKKNNSSMSYRTVFSNNNIEILQTEVKLPKLGLVKASISRLIQGRILNAAVSQTTSGKYFVSICCTDVEAPQYDSTGATVGIDLGIKSLAITSDGETFENPKYFSKSQKKLAKAQHQLSRKTIGSNNRNKARIKVARIHEKIANQRLDNIHKMTTKLVKEYDVICIEDLSVKNMIKNRKLAKSISDVAWGEVRRQLQYKCDWQHKPLVIIDRFFPSSQLCQCGYKNPKVKDLSVRYWTCPECEMGHDRDINAAQNILNEGLRLLGGD